MDLRVYYPTQWWRNIGDLASPEDKKFRWFVCAKKYFDPIVKADVVELSPGTQFYSIATGEHFVVPTPPVKEWKTKLLITQGRDKRMYEKSINAGLQGIAYLEECDKNINLDKSALCIEAGFLFHPKAVEKSTTIDDCALIAYAKANYVCIRRKIPTFPSPKEIEDVLSSGVSCEKVCRALYEYIDRYLRM